MLNLNKLSKVHCHIYACVGEGFLDQLHTVLYNLLADLFSQPDLVDRGDLLSSLKEILSCPNNDEPWRASLEKLENTLKKHETLSDYTAEYSRLFILNAETVPAQPFASCWLEKERRLMGETTLAIEKIMAGFGIGVDHSSGLLADHIVSELEFMAFLCEQDHQNMETRQWLLENHLVRWIPPFAQAIRDADPMPYYRLAADLLEQVIGWDHARLNRAEIPEVEMAQRQTVAGEEHDHA